ncbi:MAG: hypothetical protein ABW044_00335 [Cellvibrio sp.]
MKWIRRHLLIFLLFDLALMTAFGLALWPVTTSSNEEVFEIPQGTWAKRMSGNHVEILPDEIYLTLGVKNVLVLRNMDDVPQIFGPTLIMPKQSFTLPFEVASENEFTCTAHASGHMTVIVDPEPLLGLARLEWRVKKLLRYVRAQIPKPTVIETVH